MKLYKHQQKALELLQTHNYFAIFAEQGTGKTLPTLAHISDLLIFGKINNALILTTCSAIGAWYRDMEKFNSVKKELLQQSVTVINYDKISRKSSQEKYNKVWDCIVLDESQAIAYRTSNRTKFLIGSHRGKKYIPGLNYYAKYRYILTGTPISNGHLEQYYPQFEFLCPNFFGSYTEFRARYLNERQIPNTFQTMIVGYRHKEELLKMIGEHSFRVLKKDCIDLPDKLEDEVIYCPLKAKKEYKQALKNFIEEFDMDIPNPLSQMTKLRQIPNGHIKDQYGNLFKLESSKIEYLDDLMQRIGLEDNKICVYAYYKQSIQDISDFLKSKKIKHIVLNGEQKDKLIWKQFQTDPEIRVIICQWKSACAGIDLFASSNMIFYEPDLSSTVVEQTRDRIHRIGQKHPCNYYWLITENTIEEDIYKKLSKYQDFNKEAMQIVAETLTR